ncbi:hypothetical protein [uncultured Nostoc sp.]|uniref:hypothetical protein n=1 Tax=uncultured Nostoc sp. TaxID=340711 RepID=UPI0035CAF845
MDNQKLRVVALEIVELYYSSTPQTQHFHQHAIAEGAWWQRNRNYYAADKFCLSWYRL